MKTPRFLARMQRKVAVAAVGLSSLRGRPSGTISKVQDSCARLSLRQFGDVASEAEFKRELGRCTDKLRHRVRGLRHDWGAARKVLNLFLRDAFYNQFLCDRFKLRRIEPWLEIPLDRLVAKWLRKKDPALPRWDGLKHLKPKASNQYQAFASECAKKETDAGRLRVHLDLVAWLDSKARQR